MGKERLKEIPGLVPNLIRLPPGCLFQPRCPMAFQACTRERPPLFPLDSGHGVRCWLVEKEVKNWDADKCRFSGF